MSDLFRERAQTWTAGIQSSTASGDSPILSVDSVDLRLSPNNADHSIDSAAPKSSRPYTQEQINWSCIRGVQDLPFGQMKPSSFSLMGPVDTSAINYSDSRVSTLLLAPPPTSPYHFEPDVDNSSYKSRHADRLPPCSSNLSTEASLHRLDSSACQLQSLQESVFASSDINNESDVPLMLSVKAEPNVCNFGMHKLDSPMETQRSIPPTNISRSPAPLSSGKRSARKNPWGPETYSDLIAAAIQSHPEERATLQQIYDFISTNYTYFKERSDPPNSAGWKNSIRHNLSLHDKFVKCPKSSDNVKSSYWRLNADVVNKPYMRRRACSMDTVSAVKVKTRVGGGSGLGGSRRATMASGARRLLPPPEASSCSSSAIDAFCQKPYLQGVIGSEAQTLPGESRQSACQMRNNNSAFGLGQVTSTTHASMSAASRLPNFAGAGDVSAFKEYDAYYGRQSAMSPWISSAQPNCAVSQPYNYDSSNILHGALQQRSDLQAHARSSEGYVSNRLNDAALNGFQGLHYPMSEQHDNSHTTNNTAALLTSNHATSFAYGPGRDSPYYYLPPVAASSHFTPTAFTTINSRQQSHSEAPIKNFSMRDDLAAARPTSRSNFLPLLLTSSGDSNVASTQPLDSLHSIAYPRSRPYDHNSLVNPLKDTSSLLHASEGIQAYANHLASTDSRLKTEDCSVDALKRGYASYSFNMDHSGLGAYGQKFQPPSDAHMPPSTAVSSSINTYRLHSLLTSDGISPLAKRQPGFNLIPGGGALRDDFYFDNRMMTDRERESLQLSLQVGNRIVGGSYGDRADGFEPDCHPSTSVASLGGDVGGGFQLGRSAMDLHTPQNLTDPQCLNLIERSDDQSVSAAVENGISEKVVLPILT